MAPESSIDSAQAVFDKAQSYLRPALGQRDPVISAQMEVAIGLSYLARAIQEIQDKLAGIEQKLARR